ncbi:MAG: hypothetical protein DWP98_03935 [Bacteroidetes bacterium]|nr:MAG: hypothetical protein DWP98_03935 [Bacteroidota bacterium]MBL1143889.1 hypothetical protein [Bacteroidota bacterium]MCB0802959.1 ATP-binding protein [Flavobacteriales bacterium]NOG56690.1 hypothetical protein [Bacteroidota bacterium]
MPKLLIVLFIFFANLSFSTAQGNLLNLDSTLSYNTSILEKTKQLVESDTSTARQQLNKLILNISEFNDSIFQNLADQKLHFFYNYFSVSELIKEVNGVLEIAKQRKDTSSIAYYYDALAEIYLNETNFDKALQNTMSSLELYEAMQNLDRKGELLLKKGAIEYATGDYLKSVETIFDAANQFKETGSKYHLAFSYLQIGITYFFIEHYKESVYNYKLAQREFLGFNDSLGSAICQTNIGLVYLEQKKYDTANILFYDALPEIIKSDRKITIGQLYHNLGVSYSGLNQIDSALYYLRKGLQIDTDINYEIGKAAGLLELAKVKFKLNEVDSSIWYGKQCLFIMDTIPDIEIESEASLFIANRLYERNEFEKSAHYFHRHLLFQDSLRIEDKKINEIARDEGNKLDRFKDELRISKQREQLIAKEIKNQKQLIVGLIVFGALLIGSLFLASIINQRNKKLNSKLVENQKVIESDLQVKKSLLKEIHHRVKNNLQVISSMLSIQNQYVTDPRLNEIIEESRARINSMALIHESLYKRDTDDITSFSTYVQNLIPQLIHTYQVDENKIHLRMDVDDVKLSIDESIPCGLLINEVITNAIKHAFPNDRKGEIKIEMSEHDAKITLKISDNGIGLSEEIQPDNQDSFGFLLIYTLAEQLEAKMKVYNENGLSFTFQWKHKNYQMLS